MLICVISNFLEKINFVFSSPLSFYYSVDAMFSDRSALLILQNNLAVINPCHMHA